MERALSAGGWAWRPVATSAAAETGDQDAGAAIRGIEIGEIEMRGQSLSDSRRVRSEEDAEAGPIPRFSFAEIQLSGD